MNITILGAAGFIGTNLSLNLARDQKNNLLLVDQNLDYFARELKNNYDNIKMIESDFDKTTDFEKILEGQDIVYHLVSTSIPSNSNMKISEELTSNVVTTAVLLDACVKMNIKRLVFISSGGTVYGKSISCPINEDESLKPISSYGLQKVTIEKLLYLYRYIYGLDYRIIRLSNPYGPYQRPNGVLGALTTFTYKALSNDEITVYGDGSVVRDYIYIDDAIRAILNIVNSDSSYKLYNIGCGYGTSINQLLTIISESLGRKLNVKYTQGRKVDVPVNYLDISRFEREFGKIQTVSLSEGIHKTADFLRLNYLNS